MYKFLFCHKVARFFCISFLYLCMCVLSTTATPFNLYLLNFGVWFLVWLYLFFTYIRVKWRHQSRHIVVKIGQIFNFFCSHLYKSQERLNNPFLNKEYVILFRQPWFLAYHLDQLFCFIFDYYLSRLETQLVHVTLLS